MVQILPLPLSSRAQSVLEALRGGEFEKVVILGECTVILRDCSTQEDRLKLSRQRRISALASEGMWFGKSGRQHADLPQI
jgi:hypothetical protein